MPTVPMRSLPPTSALDPPVPPSPLVAAQLPVQTFSLPELLTAELVYDASAKASQVAFSL